MATGLHNLGLIYHMESRYAQAEQLYKRVLAIREKSLGLNHPGVAQDLSNLAELYYTQGQYALAVPLYNRALIIHEKVFGARSSRCGP